MQRLIAALRHELPTQDITKLLGAKRNERVVIAVWGGNIGDVTNKGFCIMAWRLFPSMWPLCNNGIAQPPDRRNEAPRSDATQDQPRADTHAGAEQHRSRPA